MNLDIKLIRPWHVCLNTPKMHKAKWGYGFYHSYPRHYVEVNGQGHASVTLCPAPVGWEARTSPVSLENRDSNHNSSVVQYVV